MKRIFKVGDKIVSWGEVGTVIEPADFHNFAVIKNERLGCFHAHVDEFRHFIKPRIVIDFVDYRLAVFTTYAKVNLVNEELELFKKAERWCAHMNDRKRLEQFHSTPTFVQDLNKKYPFNNILPFELLG